MQRVLMLPGFGGRADQPILIQLEAAMRPLGLSGLRASLPRARPSPGFEREVESARILGRSDPQIVAYVGRSFGGRVLARLALETRPRALVLLSFPVRSQEGRRRQADEVVLEQLRCPTLIVQGSKDPLGPIRTFERLAIIPNATHAFGRAQKQAIMAAAGWLARALGARASEPV